MEMAINERKITLVCRDTIEAKEYLRIIEVIKNVKEAEEQRLKEVLKGE
jgi:hypothetical protein